MNISNELKIGITVVVALIVAYTGFKILEDSPIFGQSASYHTYFQQVDGLTEGTPIFAQGVRVGSVRNITLLGLDSVRVDFGISTNFRPTDGSIAVLQSVDVLGTRAITIRRSEYDQTVSEDGFVRGFFDAGLAEQVSSYAQEVIPGITESTGNLSSVLGQIDTVLKDGGRDDISNLLSQLQQTATEVNKLVDERNQDLARGMETLNSILQEVDTLATESRDDIQSLLSNLERTSSELDALSGELRTTTAELNTMLVAINEKQGTLGMLVYDQSLYNNIDSLAYNLNALVQELNENPRHFLRHLRLVRLF